MVRNFIAILFFGLVASFVAASPLEKRAGGRGTFYAVGLGACGNTNTDDEAVVALNTADFASGAHCGDSISITANGKTASATVVDLCPGCAPGGIDMSPSLFSQFADQSVGVVQTNWSFA